MRRPIWAAAGAPRMRRLLAAAVLVPFIAGCDVSHDNPSQKIRRSFASLIAAAQRRDADSFCELVWPAPGGPPVHTRPGVIGDGTAAGDAYIKRLYNDCVKSENRRDLGRRARQLGGLTITRVHLEHPYIATATTRIRRTGQRSRVPLYFVMIAGRWRFVIFFS
ncbi:MAG: hypothetical protein ACJ764_00630 [Solirubrobacteraceae bacterium]